MLDILDELSGDGSDIYFEIDLVNLGDVCYDAIQYELEQIQDHITYNQFNFH